MQSKNCNFFKSQIYNYMSDQLSDTETAELLAHIELCPECKHELDILKSIISASASLPQIDVPDGLKESVFERLNAEKQSVTPKRYKFKRFASIALPAAACIALSIGVFSGGLYHKFVASDDIISSGDVTPIPIQANTEQADATENTEQSVASANVASDSATESTTPIKSKPQPKAEQRDKNAVSSSQSDSTVGNSDLASENTTIESDNAQTESSPPDTPSVASANAPRERFIAEQPTSDSSDTEQASNDSIAVASIGAAKAESAAPASCIVITENISAFSNEFGVTAEEGELHFELDADKWQDFLSFAENTGAELNTDYSADSNGYVSITIRKP